jgi:phosphatidylserine decarboxylase
MISPHSYKIVGITTLGFIFLVIINFFISSKVLIILTVITGFVFLFNFFFFRDPQRNIPAGDHIILSPADGKIIKIAEIDEPLYFKEKTQMISIFMSVFNVHVNRIPLSGKIEYLDYQVGKFLAAFDHKASEDNEQSIIGISDGRQKILFKQIAGVIARRIVYNIKMGQEVKQGDRFGLIHYGSRLDIFVPLNVDIRVKLDDKVTSGETIIGEYK